MGWLVFYRDPKKKQRQKLQLALLGLLLPMALASGSNSYRLLKAFDEAEAIYHRAERALHEGNYPQAIQGFRETLEIYPEFSAAWEGLAVAYYSTRQFELEVATYKSAVAVLPRNGELHRELATALHRTGDHRSELEHLKIASRLLGKEDGLTVQLLKRAEREAKAVVEVSPDQHSH